MNEKNNYYSLGTKSLFLGLVFALIPQISANEIYKFDLAHSYIGFAVKHMVVSTTKGNFTTFSGQITIKPNELESSVDVSIDASSINTSNERRDKHLRGSDFFDVEKYPNITFKSTKLTKKQDGYVLYGDFTMHGITKNIEIPFEINGPIKNTIGKSLIGIEAAITLDRQEYGISYNKTLDKGGLMIGNKVKVELHIEAIKQ
jgi:polyisoprenoid-binding protein YceI